MPPHGPATGEDTAPDSWSALVRKAVCGAACITWSRCLMIERGASAPLLPCTPTISTGPCPPTVAGPYAAWMPRKSLHGRTCGVSCDGGRARALQPTHSVEGAVCITWSRCFMIERGASAPLLPCTPTISTGPCPSTVAGPYAAWMPRKSLHGRTCGVSCDGGRARALQPTHSVEGAVRTPHQKVGRPLFEELSVVRRASRGADA